MENPSRVILDPAVLAGKPVIRGTRLSVEFVIGLMAEGWNEAEFCGTIPDSRTTTSRPVLPTRAMC
jgi:uncharacterized protein (DUF433 family)